MSLPALYFQMLYAQVAWSTVLAAFGIGALAWRRPLPAKLAWAWVALAFVACALPGPGSPVYWLSLAFQFPSGLLVAFCAMTISANVNKQIGYRALPTSLATALVAGGLVLYLDGAGSLSLGLYARGFGPSAALAGLLIGLAATVAIGLDRQRSAGFAVLLAVMLFALCRLPTGNVWDAMLDPLLWLWAMFSLLARAATRRRSGRLPIQRL